jgi:hypothetical protein
MEGYPPPLNFLSPCWGWRYRERLAAPSNNDRCCRLPSGCLGLRLGCIGAFSRFYFFGSSQFGLLSRFRFFRPGGIGALPCFGFFSPGQLGALLSFSLFRLSQFGTLSRCRRFSTGNVGSLVRFLFACPRLFGVALALQFLRPWLPRLAFSLPIPLYWQPRQSALNCVLPPCPQLCLACWIPMTRA